MLANPNPELFIILQLLTKNKQVLKEFNGSVTN